MKTIFNTTLKTTAAVLAIIAMTGTANAAEIINPMTEGLTGTMIDREINLSVNEDAKAPLNIGVARLDGGRLISVPYGENQDWHFLDKRTDANFTTISAASYLASVPEIAFGGTESPTKLDEIRMTAAKSNMDYVVVYNVGRDAEWASLGGAALLQPGLEGPTGSAVYRNAEAKALLINTKTGKVFGSAKAQDAEFGVGELTDDVQGLVEALEISLKPSS